MKVSQFMTPKDRLVWCEPTTDIETISRRMVESKVSCCVVCRVEEEGKHLFPVGIVTKDDLVRECIAGAVAKTEPVSTIMTTGAVAVDKDAPRDAAAEMIMEHHVHHLVVVDGPRKELIGVLSSWDIARETVLDARAWPYSRSSPLWSAF